MERFKKLGVFLDGSPADDEALKYAGAFAERALADTLVCVYVHGRGSDLGQPHPGQSEFSAYIRKHLSERMADRAEIQIHDGTGIPEILRSARDQELDLIVAGRRLPSDEMSIGSAFTRLARKSPCSVLVVPVYARVHLSRMLVPVDFSDHSKWALETAAAIARASGHANPQLVAQNVFRVGYGYKKTGASFHEAGQQLGALNEEKLDKFVAKVDMTGLDMRTIVTCSEQLAAAVCECATAMKMDMIVVGSRGKSATAVALLGATAERILMSSPLPVLIVKKKGETTHLLSALLGSD